MFLDISNCDHVPGVLVIIAMYSALIDSVVV